MVFVSVVDLEGNSGVGLPGCRGESEVFGEFVFCTILRNFTAVYMINAMIMIVKIFSASTYWSIWTAGVGFVGCCCNFIICFHEML